MSITVKSQSELDQIPIDTNEQIYIEFGTHFCPAVVKNKYKYRVVARENSSVEARGNSSIVAWENSSVVARENSSVVARENSSVVAWENSSVEARGNSSIVAWENSSVVARENSSIVAWENSSVVAWENSSVEARENSSVVARENSSVEAWGNSSVEAWGNSSVVARENSSVVAWENSSVEARGNSSIVAWENSSVVARENSSIVAWENSSVVAWENSSVEARENSSVEAWGNSQIVDRQLAGGRIQISGNARKVYMPKTIEDFMSFYGIKHDKTMAVFYKAVHKRDNEYHSDYDNDFEYFLGEKITEPNCDKNIKVNCGSGIHISHLNYALDFGGNWNNLAILELEVKIKDIVLPIGTDGKVRTPEAKVIREIPLSECGLYGKILSQRRSRDA